METTDLFCIMYGEATYHRIRCAADGDSDRDIIFTHHEKHDEINTSCIGFIAIYGEIIAFEFYNGNYKGDGIESFVRLLPGESR